MNSGIQTRFHFEAIALEPELFSVESFSGEEAISQPYRFEINLVSSQADIDLNLLLSTAATLYITQTDDVRKFHGIIAEIDLVDQRPDGRFNYRAVLVPRFWLLSLTQQNQIFQYKSVPDIVRELLLQGDTQHPGQFTHTTISPDYFELRLRDETPDGDIESNYPLREYVVQYNETNLNFLARLMEHEGMFYYFEQHDDSEKLIITDDNSGCASASAGYSSVTGSPEPINAAADIHYQGAVSKNDSSTPAIRRFSSKHKQLPQLVVLNDYNYRLPHIALEATGHIYPNGVGRITEYGAHYKTPEQGQRYARFRAEEIRCQQHIYCGESNNQWLGAGLQFSLTGHFLNSLNRSYLISRVQHQGKIGARAQQAVYNNTFSCQASSVPFRPPRIAHKPKLYGIMNATIDASGDGQRAEIDEQGRYKVQLPFDISGSGEGKASRFIRMATPYGGSKQGMHFPLLKGTEVIWTCIDGDLDRPIIVGTVPNPLNKSVVTEDNKTANVIKTPGGIHMEFNDGLPESRSTICNSILKPTSEAIQATTQGTAMECCAEPHQQLNNSTQQLSQQQHLSSSPSVFIATPTAVTEGQDMSFAVTLSQAASNTTTLTFTVSGNGAQSTSDVSVDISAGSTSGTVTVSSASDTNVDNATITLMLNAVTDTTYSASVGVATATGIVKDTNIGTSSSESTGNKRFKLKVPEWHNSDSVIKSSYWRLGNADSTELIESRSDIELGLNSTTDAGVFDYTDGNRTEITDGDREIYVNGKHRMTINNGGLGLYDAEPIYSLWFDELPVGWHKIETGFSSSTAASFGSSETLTFGNTFSGTAGLNTSVSLAGTVTGNLVGSVGFDIGFSVSGSNGYSVSYSTAGSIEKVEKNKTIDAGKSITLTVGGTDTAAKVAYGTAMAAVIGGVGGQFATTMAQAIGAKEQQNEWQPAEAAACQGIGITASALAWVAAMKMGAGIVTAEKIRQSAPSSIKPFLKITDTEILLQCGDSSISLKSDGTIDIGAKMINIEGEEKINLTSEVYVYEGDVTIQDKDLWVSKGDVVVSKGDIDVDTGVLNTSNGNSY